MTPVVVRALEPLLIDPVLLAAPTVVEALAPAQDGQCQPRRSRLCEGSRLRLRPVTAMDMPLERPLMMLVVVRVLLPAEIEPTPVVLRPDAL